MASARGASRAGRPQEEFGPKKRSRTEIAEEGDNEKEGQKSMFVFNNQSLKKIKRRDLVARPVEINEYCSLKLSRPGKPACNF